MHLPAGARAPFIFRPRPGGRRSAGPGRTVAAALVIAAAALPAAGLPASAAGNAAPIGVIDSVTTTLGSVTVTGWTLDPDTTAPIAAHVYLDGASVGVIADGSRPDVGKAFGKGDRHGYTTTMAATPGKHTVCVYAINATPGHNPLLGCRTVTVSNQAPIGVIDSVTATDDSVTVSGWTLDPDTTAPIAAHVHLGTISVAVTADVSRPDVDAAFGKGDRHGYTVTMPATPGRHNVCVYAINATAGTNPGLGCRAVSVRQTTTVTPPAGNGATGAGSATGAANEDGAPSGLAPALLPFAASSPWRLGVATGARFAPASDPRNVAIADVDGATSAWVNRGKYSHPIAWASTSDPLAAMTDSFHQQRGVPQGGTWLEHIPPTARVADGTDKHMHVITPDRRYVQEHYLATRTSDTEWKAKRRHQVDLTGSGIGPQNGTRAYGGSAVGGLIRAWEVDPAHPLYTGKIQHPLAVALRPDQLYYSGIKLPQDGVGGMYNRAGYGLEQGYVWPATEQDSASAFSYSGAVPMGSYFAIPPEVDLASLGLRTEAARMVARAAQDYGVYVTDRSGASTFYLEDDGGAATGAFHAALVGPSYTATDVKRIFKALRVVTSNDPGAPNGGPLGAPRRGATPVTVAP